VESVKRWLTGRGAIDLFTVNTEGAYLVCSVERDAVLRVHRVALSVNVDIEQTDDTRMLREILAAVMFGPGTPFGDAPKTHDALCSVSLELAGQAARWNQTRF